MNFQGEFAAQWPVRYFSIIFSSIHQFWPMGHSKGCNKKVSFFRATIHCQPPHVQVQVQQKTKFPDFNYYRQWDQVFLQRKCLELKRTRVHTVLVSLTYGRRVSSEVYKSWSTTQLPACCQAGQHNPRETQMWAHWPLASQTTYYSKLKNLENLKDVGEPKAKLRKRSTPPISGRQPNLTGKPTTDGAKQFDFSPSTCQQSKHHWQSC